MKLLLVGATGLVGQQVLSQALDDPRVHTLVTPVRRPLTTSHDKLVAPIVRFDDLPADADWWQADAAICTLGTTIKKAGSRETRQCGILITRVEDQHREQTGEGRMSETDTTRKKDEKSPFSGCMERRPPGVLPAASGIPIQAFP